MRSLFYEILTLWFSIVFPGLYKPSPDCAEGPLASIWPIWGD